MSRKTVTFCLEPQKASPRGWVLCAEHQAGRYAIFRVTRMTRKGHPPTTIRKMVASVAAGIPGSKQMAEEILGRQISYSRKPDRNIDRKKVKALFRSMTRAEYDDIQERTPR